MSAINAVLSPLIKLWLKSQVEAVSDLEVQIHGTSRQIVQGDIPKARVSGQNIIYQGLHVSNLNLIAESIRLNIPQMLQGEALKLLDPISVYLNATLNPEDLQSSLQADLVTEAIGSNTTQPTSDDEIRNVLQKVLEKVGDEFILENLTITDGSCYCQGSFKVAATE